MRKLVLLLLLAGMTLPAFGAKRVTVDQLEQIVAAASGKSDAKIAQQLTNLELTERLNPTRFLRMEAALPGVDSRRALVVLADLSAFLAPPVAEIPATATPDFAAQKQIVNLAVDYASKTIAQLPNFYASRDTIHFEDTPPGQRANASMIPYEPMHAVERVTDTVLYRKGEEVVDPGAGKQQGAAIKGLTTKGVFGPILGTVLIDSAHGKLAWSHWEQGANGPQAVFRFDIPREKSHYEVQFCCIPGSTGNDEFKQYSGYHGEITVDPVSGTILRLTLQADLKQSDPLSRSDIMVEYGPVEIGDRTYICPIKSVSVTIAPPQAEEHMAIYFSGSRVDKNIWAARDTRQTRLNDVVFQQYHMFRSSARILTENDAEQAGKPEETAVVETIVTTVPAAAETAAASVPVAATVPAPAAAPTPAPEPTTPEVSVTETSGMPNTPAAPGPAPHETGFTLRLTTRLVDVGVVALDKKGHPVTDLTPDDFEIYDNGRRQTVRFLQAVGATAEKPAQAANQPGAAQDEAVYSNRHAELAGTKTGTTATEGNTTILLVDSNNLAWTDLNNAREQMLRFVQTLPAGERVGLYVQQGRGFQVEVEGTADHPRLVSALRKWMPNAQDLAQSQETEKRNRQQFDEVLHASDLDYVNGTPPTDMVSNMADPQLRDMGSNPGRESLAILLSAARHLAAVPGHKNLVWVASDNVLANFTDRAVGSDKGGKHIDGFALRAQEALNEAHVSVYPLDASQLEASIPDASLQNRNVELSQSVTVSEGGGGGSHGGESAQPPGRITAEMQNNIRPIQSIVRDMAEATGGRVFRRAGDIATDLKGVVEEGRGSYLLAYTPDTPADDQFHQLTVKLATRRGITLRYRTGYLCAKDPDTPKERFRLAVWQPLDAREIAVSAWPVAAYTGATLKLNIAINDLALKLGGDRWKDKLDIFVVHRAADGLHTRITGRTLTMSLLPATYQKYLTEGIPFEQFVEKEEGNGSIRILVVDENSGRMGSVTLPAAIFKGSRDTTQ